jgi:rod shape determining protein RodA
MPDKGFTLRKQTDFLFDWQTFLLTLFLVTAGLLSVYSATYESSMSSIFNRQLIASGIGIAMMIGVMYIPKRLLKAVSLPIYLISIGMLIYVLFFGVEINATKGWIRLPGFTIQPAETAKFGVILGVAWHLASKGRHIKNIRDLGIVLLMVLIPAFLILRQPDIGSTSVLLAILIGLLFWSGFDSYIVYIVVLMPIVAVLALKGDIFFYIGASAASLFAFLFRRRIIYTLIGIAIIFSVGFGAKIGYSFLKDYQKARIETFLNPGTNLLGSGYNVNQSVMAVGSGGLTGKGYLHGTQTQLRYIPMQWTDFIYSVPTEEFGFLGGSLIILAYALLVWRAIKIGYETDSVYYSLVAAGTATMILYHALINIGMAMGIMPVTGIPLPLMSAGGSSLIVNLVLIGLLLNAYRDFHSKRSFYK